jgi:hypothetical protein
MISQNGPDTFRGTKLTEEFRARFDISPERSRIVAGENDEVGAGLIGQFNHAFNLS